MEQDRVRRHTAATVLARIDETTRSSLTACAEGRLRPEDRLRELDREWDLDRVVEAEAATVGLTGVLLGAFVDRRLGALAGVAASALALYGVTGLYPWLPLFRRMGIRTAGEIDRERYALKALRGDFFAMPAPAGEAVVL